MVIQRKNQYTIEHPCYVFFKNLKYLLFVPFKIKAALF